MQSQCRGEQLGAHPPPQTWRRRGARSAGLGSGGTGTGGGGGDGRRAVSTPWVQLFVTPGRLRTEWRGRSGCFLWRVLGKRVGRLGCWGGWRVGRRVPLARAPGGEGLWANSGMIWWGGGEALLCTFWGVVEVRASRYLCRGSRQGNDYVGGHVGTSAFI